MSAGMRGDWVELLGGRWPALALGYRYEVQLGKMLDEKRISGEHLCPYLRNADVQWGRINTDDLPQMDFDPADRQRYSLRRGDLVVCEGGEVGRAALWQGRDGDEICFQKALHRLRPYASAKEFPPYMFYALQAAAALQAYANGGKATIAHLPAEAFRRIRFPMPPHAEQQRIANFLDEQTARIDALIAEKEALSERLREFRRSAVSNAITEGLPGWHSTFVSHPFLGRLPSAWRAGKFRYYVSVRSGQVDPEAAAYTDMVLVAPNHIESGTGRLLATETAAEQAAESGKYWCDAGDVLYSKIRPALRKVTAAPFDCLCSADMYPLKGIAPLSNEYLLWYLLSEPFSDFAIQESMRVAMPKLNRETLADAVIPLPDPAEQREIVTYIASVTAKVDAVLMHATEHIDRLREYRSSLISAAATGQFDLDAFEQKVVA